MGQKRRKRRQAQHRGRRAVSPRPKIPAFSADLGEGITVSRRTSGDWRLAISDISKLRDKLGKGLLVSFLNAFMVSDRLTTLTHLLGLNHKLAARSIGHRRNHNALVWLMWGTMFEAVSVIESLALAGTGEELKNSVDAEAWRALVEMRTRWKKDAIAHTARNKFAFHFGDESMMGEGLEAACRERAALTLVAGDSGASSDSWSPIGHDVLLQGSGISATDFAEFADKVREDHARFTNHLQRAFFGVLRARGLPIPSSP